MSTAALAMKGSDALRPQPPGGMGSGALLALAVHALLVLALAVSVNWRSQTPQTVSAELWAAVPQVAAPRAVESAPVPAPPPPPAPVPKPVPVTPPPPPAPAPTPAPAPDIEAQIAIEKARQLEKQKAEAERAERAERERLAKEKADREKAERLAQEKAERERLAKQKAERDKAERERVAKAQAEAKDKAREQQAQREAQEKREQAAAEQRLAKQREDNLKRMLGQAGATGSPGSTGTALRDAAPSANYAGKLIATIKPNLLLTDPVSGKPAADVEVRAAPSGTIISRRLVKRSGNDDWDNAVLRAIDRTGDLPRDVDGRVPPVMVITFTP